MGITANEFFENIYSVIFSPKAFYEKKDITISVRLALGTVIFILLLSKIAAAVFNGSILLLTFFTSLLFYIVAGVIFWFLTALFFEYIAKIFSCDGNLSKVLFYTAFAPVPYIFFAPLNLIKQFNILGYILGSLVELILYFWIIFLYAYSVRAAYNISLSRSFMLIFLPIVSSVFTIYWLVCFFVKIGDIFSL